MALPHHNRGAVQKIAVALFRLHIWKCRDIFSSQSHGVPPLPRKIIDHNRLIHFLEDAFDKLGCDAANGMLSGAVGGYSPVASRSWAKLLLVNVKMTVKPRPKIQQMQPTQDTILNLSSLVAQTNMTHH